MCSLLRIDRYQGNYFVIDSFQQLFDVTAPEFGPIYTAVLGLPLVDAGAVPLPGAMEFAPAA